MTVDPPSQNPEGSPPSSVGTGHVNRRTVPRYLFFAIAEVIEIASETRLSARTSELSLRGCYIDIINPLPEGTEVRLRLQNSNRVLEVPAKVIYSHPGFGMGIFFSAITDEQRKLLEGWLADLSPQG